MSTAGPPLNPRFIIPSEYGAGGQYVGPADGRRELTDAERAAQQRQNLVSVDDVRAMFTDASAFAWMHDRAMFGPIVRGTKHWSGIKLVNAMVRVPTVTEYVYGDNVAAAIAEVRGVVAALRA